MGLNSTRIVNQLGWRRFFDWFGIYRAFSNYFLA